MRFTLFIITTISILWSTGLSSQENKELTLEEAILKQYSDLGPNRVRGLDWLNETSYIYRKGKGEEEIIYVFDLKKNKKRDLLNLADFKDAMGKFEVEVKSLPRF